MFTVLLLLLAVFVDGVRAWERRDFSVGAGVLVAALLQELYMTGTTSESLQAQRKRRALFVVAEAEAEAGSRSDFSGFPTATAAPAPVSPRLRSSCRGRSIGDTTREPP